MRVYGKDERALIINTEKNCIKLIVHYLQHDFSVLFNHMVAANGISAQEV